MNYAGRRLIWTICNLDISTWIAWQEWQSSLTSISIWLSWIHRTELAMIGKREAKVLTPDDHIERMNHMDGTNKFHLLSISESLKEFPFIKSSGGGQYFVKHLNEGHKGWIVWDKGIHGLTMSDCELAYSNFDKPTRVVVINRFDIKRDGPIHPTQKPISLYQWIFENYAKSGQRILDTHVGSASSLIAAHDAGLTYIGFEIDEYYYKLSKKRLDQYTAQMSIFDLGVERE